jgi:hypothetical protein
MARIAFVALFAAVLSLAGFSSPGSACTKSVIPSKDIDEKSPSFAFLADRTMSSIHRLNLIDYTDTIIGTGLGAVRGISLSNHHLFVFNDDAQLYRMSFDQSWNLISSELFGSLESAGHYDGNAIYTEGSDLYTAGPCGIARFGLSPDPPFLRFKETVAQVNSVSFTTNPAGMLFLVDTDSGVLYQVGITAGRRDWTTLQPYKRLRIDRAASVAADSQGNLLVAVSNYRLVSAPPLCGGFTPAGGSGSTPPPDIPEGVSFIVRVDADTRQERYFGMGSHWISIPQPKELSGLTRLPRLWRPSAKDRSPIMVPTSCSFPTTVSSLTSRDSPRTNWFPSLSRPAISPPPLTSLSPVRQRRTLFLPARARSTP